MSDYIHRDPDEEEAYGDSFLRSVEVMEDSLQNVRRVLSQYEDELHSRQAVEAIHTFYDNVKLLEEQMEQYKSLANSLKKDAERLRNIAFRF